MMMLCEVRRHQLLTSCGMGTAESRCCVGTAAATMRVTSRTNARLSGALCNLFQALDMYCRLLRSCRHHRPPLGPGETPRPQRLQRPAPSQELLLRRRQDGGRASMSKSEPMCAVLRQLRRCELTRVLQPILLGWLWACSSGRCSATRTARPSPRRDAGKTTAARDARDLIQGSGVRLVPALDERDTAEEA